MTNENTPKAPSLKAVRIKNAEIGVANVEAYLERMLYGRRPATGREAPVRDRVLAYIQRLNEGIAALDVAEAEKAAAVEAADA